MPKIAYLSLFRFPIVLTALAARALFAAAGSNESPENYRLEIVASVWRMSTNGNIRYNNEPINLVTDLGVGQRKYIFDGKLTLQPRHKQRIVIEGLPISIRGLNTVSRSVDYFGERFTVNETVQTSAQINYIYAGYHHDWISNGMGRFGTSIGAAYLGLQGSIQGQPSGINKANSLPFGAPLAGVDFRIFPLRGKQWIEIEGGVRGMSAGSYGYWVEGSASAGGRIGPFGLLAGYREMLVNFHQTDAERNGIAFRMHGPVLSLLYNW